MADLSDIRARLRDRQKKAGALGTADTYICLDLDLIAQLADLKTERDDAAEQAETPQQTGKKRLGSAPAAEAAPTDFDAQIEAKEAEVREASIRVVFRAASSSKYQEILNAHPEAGGEDSGELARFLDALSAECLYQIWQGDQMVPVEDGDKAGTWADITSGTSYGEWDKATTVAYILNKRTVDVPFSQKPSKKTQPR